MTVTVEVIQITIIGSCPKIINQYDADGNPTWRYDALQNSGATQWSQKYEYDRLNRLSCAMQGAIAHWQGDGGQQSISPEKNWVWNDTGCDGQLGQVLQ